MKLSIWQQFSSNHSADFVVIGKFTTLQKAEEVAEIFRRIFTEITEDRRKHIESGLETLTPREQEIKQQYQIQSEWNESLVWTYNAEITIVDNHLLIENKLLSQNWTNSAYIVEEILQTYTPDTWVADTGDSFRDFITFDLYCVAPNERLAIQIYEKFSAHHQILVMDTPDREFIDYYKVLLVRAQDEGDTKQAEKLAEKVELLERLFETAYGDPQLPPDEFSETGQFELGWETNDYFVHHPQQGVRRNGRVIEFIDVELGPDMDDLQVFIGWLRELGFKDIEYQFHSNTHNWYSFTLAAKFDSQSKAQQANDKLQKLLQKIANWQEQNPVDAINLIRNEKASAVEKEIAEEYGIEWDCHLYWSNHKWLEKHTTATIVNNYLILVTLINYKASTPYTPIKGVLEKLGASVLADEHSYVGAPNFVIDITCNVGSQLIGKEIQQSTEAYLLCKSRDSKLSFMPWIHFSSNINNLSSEYLEQLRQKAEEYSLAENQAIMTFEDSYPRPETYSKDYVEKWRAMWKDFNQVHAKLPAEEHQILRNVAREIDIHCMKNVEPVIYAKGLLKFNKLHFESFPKGLLVFIEWLKSKGCINITFNIEMADGEIETERLWS